MTAYYPEVLKNRLGRLEEILNSYGSMTVALSGGVDSVFLTAFAFSIWHDDRISAITAVGPHFAADELEYANRLCKSLGIAHKTVDVSSILRDICHNPPDRCYICKKGIFSSLKEQTLREGRVLADGTNLDDMSDYRPGIAALKELGIASPLKEVGLTKADIRAGLRAMAYNDPKITAALSEAFPGGIWNKPAFACLASRIPYGEEITTKKLQAIYRAEMLLREKGFRQIRVRHHGDVARIEVLPQDRKKFFNESFMEQINDAVKKCGFKFAALDLGGYKMGNLNEEAASVKEEKHEK